MHGNQICDEEDYAGKVFGMFAKVTAVDGRDREGNAVLEEEEEEEDYITNREEKSSLDLGLLMNEDNEQKTLSKQKTAA